MIRKTFYYGTFLLVALLAHALVILPRPGVSLDLPSDALSPGQTFEVGVRFQGFGEPPGRALLRFEGSERTIRLEPDPRRAGVVAGEVQLEAPSSSGSYEVRVEGGGRSGRGTVQVESQRLAVSDIREIQEIQTGIQQTLSELEEFDRERRETEEDLESEPPPPAEPDPEPAEEEPPPQPEEEEPPPPEPTEEPEPEEPEAERDPFRFETPETERPEPRPDPAEPEPPEPSEEPPSEEPPPEEPPPEEPPEPVEEEPPPEPEPEPVEEEPAPEPEPAEPDPPEEEVIEVVRDEPRDRPARREPTSTPPAPEPSGPSPSASRPNPGEEQLAAQRESLRRQDDYEEFFASGFDREGRTLPPIHIGAPDDLAAVMRYFGMGVIAVPPDLSFYVWVDVGRRHFQLSRDVAWLRERYALDLALVLDTGPFRRLGEHVAREYGRSPGSLRMVAMLPDRTASYIGWKALQACRTADVRPADVRRCDLRFVPRSQGGWQLAIGDLHMKDGRTIAPEREAP